LFGHDTEYKPKIIPEQVPASVGLDHRIHGAFLRVMCQAVKLLPFVMPCSGFLIPRLYAKNMTR
jgi:hypothetical protein